MLRLCALAALLLLCCVQAPNLAQAQGQLQSQRRVALVIGNARYAEQPALPNPRNDATALATLLRRDLGFEVLAPVLDGTLARMDQALDAFTQAAEGADVALFFYAGHGLELEGQNLLVPVDARLAHERDAMRQTVPLDQVLTAVRGARSKIVLLDACRDNPLARGMVRLNPGRALAVGGLAEVRNVPVGTLVAFAAAPGRTASDGRGANSPFTEALLRHLSQPEEIRLVMGDVGQTVSKATGGAQEPWVNFTGLAGRLYLKAVPAPQPDDATAQQLAAMRQQLEALQRERAAAPAAAPAAPPAAPPAVPAPAAPPAQPVAAQGRARRFPVGIGGSFRDCADCPEMVVLPAGSFLMGTPESEPGRGTDEGPQHRVTLRTPLALGRSHVTVAQYRAFVEATARPDPPSCWAYDANQRWGDLAGFSWRRPGFPQTADDPVVCLSWDDAAAYAAWLARRTGKGYRLPTEAEWEYAARAGGTSPWWWGSDPGAVCTYANAGDRTVSGAFPLLASWLNATCTDGFLHTSPVGRFPANGFGLVDMAGNATQWVDGCYLNGYQGAPADAATPVTQAACDSRAHRGGGSWTGVAALRVGARGVLVAGTRRQENGMRVARGPEE